MTGRPWVRHKRRIDGNLALARAEEAVVRVREQGLTCDLEQRGAGRRLEDRLRLDQLRPQNSDVVAKRGDRLQVYQRVPQPLASVLVATRGRSGPGS